MASRDNEAIDIASRAGSVRIEVLLFALAFVVRVGFELVADSISRPPYGDEIEFTHIARALIDGHGFSQNGIDPTMQRLPGYPGFLALLLMVTGSSTSAARWLSLLVSSLLPVLVCRLGREVMAPTVGVIAGLLAVIHLPFVENASYLMSDTLFAILSALVLVAAGDGRTLWSWQRGVGVGALLGLAALVRAEILLLAFLIVGYLVATTRPLRRLVAPLVGFAVAVTLIVGPWVVRNYLTFGRVQTATVGHVLAGLYNDTTFTTDEKMGEWKPEGHDLGSTSSRRPEERGTETRYVTEPEWDRELTRRALASVRQHLSRLPRMTLYKLHALAFDEGKQRALVRGPLIYLFVFGLILAVASRRTKQIVFLLLFLVYQVLLTIILYSNARLRMSMDVSFLVLAAYGLREQCALFLQRRSARIPA